MVLVLVGGRKAIKWLVYKYMRIVSFRFVSDWFGLNWIGLDLS